jgi:hypothetical protein
MSKFLGLFISGIIVGFCGHRGLSGQYGQSEVLINKF